MEKREKLSKQLLNSILIIYFIITFIVTAFHFVVEYRYTKINIDDELKKIAATFYPAIKTALWELNNDQLVSISEAVYKMPLVYGIVIKDPNGDMVINKINPLLTEKEILLNELSHGFKIEKNFNGKDIFLADMILYSDNSAVYERLKIGFTMILLNAFIKSAALLILFILAFNKHLKLPLRELTYFISNLNWKDKDNRKISVHFEDENELSILQSKFNELLSNISEEEQKRYDLIHNMKLELEKEVQARTKEIQKQKEEFEMIFKNSIDGIAILDLQSNFLNFNDAYLKMTGFSKEELLSKSCIELSIPEDMEKSKNLIKKIKEKGYIKDFEKTCLVKNGKRVIVNMSISLMPDGERIIISSKDITQSKNIEHQTRLASLGEMIGNIAHQWRQPLSVISTSATGMQVQKEHNILSDETFNETCESINRNVQYLSRTIDDFRDFVKNDSKLVEFDLKECTGNFLNLVDSTIKLEGLEVHLDLESDIEILGTPNKLIQSFLNIFNNAKDELHKKEMKNKLIFIKEKVEKGSIVITMRDNAGGIPEDILPKIFEPYFTTKHKSQGTGLGLHMCYNLIVNGMNGTINAYNVDFEYEGESYKGAEFKITLPLK